MMRTMSLLLMSLFMGAGQAPMIAADQNASDSTALRQTIQNKTEFRDAQRRLHETYGYGWHTPSETPEQLQQVKDVLRERFGPQWYLDLDRSLHQGGNQDQIQQLDREFGEVWRTATADALNYYYREIYCFNSEECGELLQPHERKKVLATKEQLEATYGDCWMAIWDEERLQSIRQQLKDEYGPHWHRRLQDILHRNDEPRISQLDSEYGEDWRAAAAQAWHDEYASSIAGFEDVRTQSEAKATDELYEEVAAMLFEFEMGLENPAEETQPQAAEQEARRPEDAELTEEQREFAEAVESTLEQWMEDLFGPMPE